MAHDRPDFLQRLSSGEARLQARTNAKTSVAILLYDRMTALDAIGPYEVLRSVPDLEVTFVARNAGLVATDSGLQMLNAERSFDDLTSADILIVPGGDARAAMRDEATLAFIRRIHETTTWTVSVCSGSLVLGAAGLLQGIRATSHWSVIDALARFGATAVRERYVRDGKIYTSAGVSAGIDAALELVSLIRGAEMARTIQLVIEYAPQPPFESGSPETAGPQTVERAKQLLADMYAPAAS